VIAPTRIPKAPGDRVKTDKRDCRRLARLHRADELVAIRIPTVQEEAVRDLCRTRGDMVDDLTRALVEDHRLHQIDTRTLSGLSTQLGHLRTALEAVAERVRGHEERIRQLERRRATRSS